MCIVGNKAEAMESTRGEAGAIKSALSLPVPCLPANTSYISYCYRGSSDLFTAKHGVKHEEEGAGFMTHTCSHQGLAMKIFWHRFCGAVMASVSITCHW